MGKQKILIADDDKDIVKLLEDRLRLEGYETVRSHDGEGTIEAIKTNLPDLILLDWRMPTGRGGVVLEFLMKEKDLKHIPVIILTGVDEDGIAKKAFQSGVQAIIQKPFDTKVLLLKIREVLGNSGR